MTQVSSFLLFAFYTIVSLVRAAQLRRLQQTRIEFVQLNSARLPSYPSESVDDECPIFVLCSRGTSRSITPSLTTCISESAGSVASGVWTYPTTPDLVDPFLISLFPGETIQCRFSIRISEFVIFYQFQDEDEACTFSYEDLEQNQIQTCGLVGGGYFSLSFRQRTQDDNSDDNNSLDFKSLSPVVQTIVVAVIIFFSTLAVAIFCIVFYSRNNVRSRRAIFQVFIVNVFSRSLVKSLNFFSVVQFCWNSKKFQQYIWFFGVILSHIRYNSLYSKYNSMYFILSLNQVGLVNFFLSIYIFVWQVQALTILLQ
eukprot:TRINITY_DN2829_c0_g1_i6.p1 TRINITY_DN2829_c0_g1~~TRINITY_DN2829_c0_g1_i6.p1  ORF type:complete len:312 (-),score=-11.77 TRINITY_DN2829_c0_g1_i6:325-1260(-)